MEKTFVHGHMIFCGDFNARLHKRLANEEDIVGPHILQTGRREIAVDSNRYLLTEFCAQYNLAIANSFMNIPAEQKITYRNISKTSHYHIGSDPKDFAELDMCLVSQSFLHSVIHVFADRSISLASHHFPLFIACHLQVDKISRNKKSRPDFSALQSTSIAEQFRSHFLQHVHNDQINLHDLSIHDHWGILQESVQASVKDILSPKVMQKNHPWISSHTLDIITLRNNARKHGDFQDERSLTKQVKKAVKQDRANWLYDVASNADWTNIGILRRNGENPKHQGRLKDRDGHIVSNEKRCEVFADYLEHIQWAARSTTAFENQDTIHDETLPVNEESFTVMEIRGVIKKLKNNRSPGLDEIPAECWKTLIADEEACRIITEFCNSCWRNCSTPVQWRLARISCLYKKGNPADTANYRPVSFLSVGYKIFASLLLTRLKQAGAEKRIHSSQFGFRSGLGTREALFLARQHIETIMASKHDSCIFLALDWAKAFDSISVEGLLTALRRFGLSHHIVQMVAEIL